MVRALSLYLPWWPIERLTRRGEARNSHGEDKRSILLVRTIANRQLIVHACRGSVEAGVRPGMTLAHARALLPDAARVEPVIREHDAVRDRQGLIALARWATRFAPLVAADHEDGLMLDITGCARLYRGERNLLDHLMRGAQSLGFTVCGAIAPTFGAAWALARFAKVDGRIVNRLEEVSSALSDLPVSGLRLDEGTIVALEEIGIQTIGQVLDVPRAQLPSRFTGELVLRIDQALGSAFETIDPVRVATPVHVAWPFKGPVVKMEVIQIATIRLLERFTNHLLHRESGVRRLRVTLERYRLTPVYVRLTLSRPTRDVRHLERLLTPRLEKVNLGHGVESIELLAEESARLPHRQRGHRRLGGEAQQVESLDEEQARLIDTLVHRLGGDRVSRTVRVESHLPEAATRLAPVDEPPPKQAARVTQHDRPTQLLERPWPVQVQAMTPDGPVMQVQWRNNLHRVVHCAGPERLTSTWWREPSGGRDYFRVQLECGRMLWLFRQARPADPGQGWFVHGQWV